MSWSSLRLPPSFGVVRATSFWLLAATICSSSAGQEMCGPWRFSDGSPATGDLLGNAVALQGDRLLVGGQFRQADPQFSGSLTIYARCGVNWFLEQDIPSPVTSSAGFGVDASLDGSTLAVGTRTDSVSGVGTGSAFVFALQEGVWIQTDRLIPSIPTNTMQFGASVVVDSGRIYVAAPMDSTEFGNAGSVYVFEQVGGVWTEAQRLLSPDLSGGDRFGDQMAAVGNVLCVGAPDEDAVMFGVGAIQVFRHDGVSFVPEQRLDPPDTSAVIQFGAIGFDGETIAGGAPRYDGDGGADSGVVWVYEERGGSWSQVQELQPTDAAGGARFGEAVEVDGNWMAVSAGSDSGAASLAGAVYLFEREDGLWVEREKLTIEHAEGGERLGAGIGGTGLALDGEFVAAGAYAQDILGVVDAGAAYVWSASGANCPSLVGFPRRASLSAGGAQTLDLVVGPASAGDLYWTVGSVSGTDPGFTFAMSRIPLNPDDYFLQTLDLGPNYPITNGVGTLDEQGRARAHFAVTPGSDPTLLGIQIDHAVVVFELGPLAVRHVSNPARIALVE